MGSRPWKLNDDDVLILGAETGMMSDMQDEAYLRELSQRTAPKCTAIIFGDGTLAAKAIDVLRQSSLKVLAVYVAQMEGRMAYAKRNAETLGIPVYLHLPKPPIEAKDEEADIARFRDGQFGRKKKTMDPIVQEVAALQPDMIISCFPKFQLPDELLELPRLGVLACFPSLLPRHAGPSAVQWSIINGDLTTGATWYRQGTALPEQSLVLAQRSVPLSSRDTAASLLAERVVPVALQALPDALRKAMDGEPGERQVWQDDDPLTTTVRPGPEPLLADWHVVIHWHESAAKISGLMRGADPFPGALAQVGAVLCRVFGRAVLPPLPEEQQLHPGTVYHIGPDGLTVSTGTSPVVISHMQPVTEIPGLRQGRLPAERFAATIGLTPGFQLVSAELPPWMCKGSTVHEQAPLSTHA